MAKFLLGVLVGIVVAALAAFIVILAIGRLFATKQPTIPANSVLMLTLSGDIPEAAPIDLGLPFLRSQNTPTVRDIWASLRAAANDNRIKAVVIEPRALLVGWGRLQEIRQDLATFKKSGKPLYALLEAPGSREYYVASVADKVFLSPEDTLNVKGFLLEVMYFKATLDKLGIDMQVDHIGRFKDAGDIFTRTNMSPETREVLNGVLDQIYNNFCSTIGQARRKSADEVKSLIDQGPFLASQAKANGLVDELGYRDEVFSDLKRKLATDNLRELNIKIYFRAIPSRGDRVALLVGEGDIATGQGENGLGNGEGIFSGPFTKTIQRIRNDRSIKAVILRVNSPGGDSLASDEILRELKLLAAAKPLIVSMSDVAASGGYYISATGTPIMAYSDTITGSIGVLYIKPDLHGLYDKLGFHEDLLTRGKLADMDSESIPLSDAARQKLHDEIQATYTAFVSKVATARNKSYDQINALAQGRVWMGAEAKQNGLVDQLGGLDAAVALARQKANLPVSGDTDLVMYPPRRSLLELLTSSSPDVLADEMAEKKLHTIFPAFPSVTYLRGGILRVFPYRLTAH